ncbi:unnamed protein product [Strongylus vulgaris]|uniref:Uncharacterized protein n=1 Tax=Strongylus vulgaris TaxID=40348 RepID=A0A3P7JZ21_STRVU|nr:unnamed protein product [Strongylus vulgaris]
MIHAADGEQGRRHREGEGFDAEQELHEEFHEADSADDHEHSEGVLYPADEGESLADIDDVADEVEVCNEC